MYVLTHVSFTVLAYKEGIQVFFSINKRFIFIVWYENNYFMSGDSHELNMLIFIPRD